MQINIETITPDIARAMLENNPENRKVRKFHYQQIAEDMRAGRWQLNGDAIRLNCDGSLIDGQHRLLACVAAGVPFQSLVIRGLDASTRATIDGGAKRSHGDRLAMAGVKNANVVAAAARVLVRIAENSAACRHSVPTVQAVIDRHPRLVESAAIASAVKCHLSPSMLAAVHYVGTFTGNGARADEFVGVFLTGIPTYPNDAAHAFRERLIQGGRGVWPDILPPLVQTWRNFSKRAPIRVIKASDDVRVPGWDAATLGI